MVTDREAYIADRLRKGITFVVSGIGTWLLLRVLFRLAQGEQTLADPELWGFVLLAVIAALWVRATRRMPRRTDTEDGFRTDSASTSSGSSREDRKPS